MPRKQRQPKARIRSPLSDALHFELMIGMSPPVRLWGWADLLGIPVADYPAAVAAAWDDHEDELLSEAHAAGFEPWGVRHRRPGRSAHRWIADFIHAHKY